MYEGAITNILSDLYGPAAAQPSPMPDLLRGQQPRQMGPTAMPPQAQMPPPMQPPPPMPASPPMQPQPQQRALPQATAQTTPWQANLQRLQGERETAMAEEQAALQPLDRSAMEKTYRERAATGQGHLLKALAAIEAGKEFAPVSQHFLRASEEAVAPMKMAGGTMTEQGFIEDPGYAQELRVKRAQAKLAQIERAEQFNLTREENARLQTERLAAQRELQEARLESARALRAMGTAMAGAFGGGATQVGSDPDTGAPVFRHKNGQLSSYNDKGQEVAYTKGFTPKGAGKGEGTEGERASAGYLGRMEAVEADIDRLSNEGGRPGYLTKALGMTSVGRLARPVVESANQQTYRAKQEDWVRAKLRKESGASIPPDEMEREIETYFPQPGEDSVAVIEAKRQARAQAIEQMRTTAGVVKPTRAPPVNPPGLPPGWSVSTPGATTPAAASVLPPGWSVTTK